MCVVCCCAFGVGCLLFDVCCLRCVVSLLVNRCLLCGVVLFVVCFELCIICCLLCVVRWLVGLLVGWLIGELVSWSIG